MKTFVLGLAALPFFLSGGPVVAADALNMDPIIVAEDKSMESTEPPFSDVNPGDEPFDSSAGAPDDEAGQDMTMEPSSDDGMGDSKSDDSMSDDSME